MKDSTGANGVLAKNLKPVYYITAHVCLGGLYFGYIIGSYNSLLESFAILDGWDSPQKRSVNEALATSAMPLGGLLASLFSTQIMNKTKSYRKAFILADVKCTLASLAMAVSVHLPLQVLARFIQGCAIGLNLTFTGIYVKQLSPEEISGSTGSLFQLFITFGVFIGFLLGLCLPQNEADVDAQNNSVWRIIVIVPALIAIIRSAIWTLSKRFRLDAPEILFRSGQDLEPYEQYVIQVYGPVAGIGIIRHQKKQYSLDKNYSDTSIAEVVPQEAEGNSIYRKKFILASVMAISQQFSGINAIMYYSNDIFRDSGAQKYSALFTATIGLVQILGTIASTAVIEVTGRRTLYLRGNLLLICALIIFTIALHVHAFVAELLAVLIFTIGFSISLGPLFWIYISDTLDERGRKYAITMSSACTLIVSLAFKPMTLYLSTVGVFSIFTIASVLAFVYVLFHMVETKGKSMQEIDKEFAPRARISQKATVDSQVEPYEEMEL